MNTPGDLRCPTFNHGDKPHELTRLTRKAFLVSAIAAAAAMALLTSASTAFAQAGTPIKIGSIKTLEAPSRPEVKTRSAR